VVGDRLDVLVANEGVATSATIEETTVGDYDRMRARRRNPRSLGEIVLVNGGKTAYSPPGGRL